jgi:hypothetical protein
VVEEVEEEESREVEAGLEEQVVGVSVVVVPPLCYCTRPDIVVVDCSLSS